MNVRLLLFGFMGLILLLSNTACENETTGNDENDENDAICGIWKLKSAEDENGKSIGASEVGKLVLIMYLDGTCESKEGTEIVGKGDYTYKEDKKLLFVNIGDEATLEASVLSLTSKILKIEFSDEFGDIIIYRFEKIGEVDDEESQEEEETGIFADIVGTWKIISEKDDKGLFVTEESGATRTLYIMQNGTYSELTNDMNAASVPVKVTGTYIFSKKDKTLTLKGKMQVGTLTANENHSYDILKLTSTALVIREDTGIKGIGVTTTTCTRD